jgi:hypothetical protein
MSLDVDTLTINDAVEDSLISQMQQIETKYFEKTVEKVKREIMVK